MSAAVLADQSKALARRLIDELWNRGNVTIANELIDLNCEHHDPATPNAARGPEGTRQLVTMYRAAFPDLQIRIDDIIAEGQMVAFRWTSSGTHRGELFGTQPTGKQITTSGISILRTAGGKVAEDWVNWDTLGLLQQIGAVKQ
jgi:steroid delta-isomerase-like uncharacterized protein